MRLEAAGDIENIQSDILIGSYFKIKHCEGILADEVNFVHRSIYEYFVALYIFESVINLQSKEEAVGKLGELLKRGRLSKQILQFTKHKFDSLTEYDMSSLVKDIFDIMLRDGMTYHTDIMVRDGFHFHTDAQYKNMLDREMNIFTNMLKVVHLWNPLMGETDDNIVSFLRHNNQPLLNLRGITLGRSALREGDIEDDDFSYVDFDGADLNWANLKGEDFSFSNLDRVIFIEANLKEANFNHAKLTRANFIRADLEKVKLVNADLRRSDLMGANLRKSNLKGADLSSADLREADLEGASLRKASLVDANFCNANLLEADLEGADLWGALFDEKQVDSLHKKYNLSGSCVWISVRMEIVDYEEYRDIRKWKKNRNRKRARYALSTVYKTTKARTSRYQFL